MREEYEKKQQNAQVINQQLYDYKLSQIKNIQQEQLQGELVRRQVEEEIERERQRELQRKARQLGQREIFKQANEDMIVYNEQLKQKDLEELKKVEEYAKKKEGMDQLRKDKEEQKFTEKQATR